MDVTQLQRIMPKAPPEWLQALVDLPASYGITTPLRQAAFIGQLAEECDQFTRLEENLNYSAERLRQVWPKHFPDVVTSLKYAFHPQMIANRAYAGRLGNGDEASGDGWLFRGRGPIQITGHSTYVEAGKAIGVDLVSAPGAAATPATGVLIAAWYWNSRNLNELADCKDYRHITEAINGGMLGYTARVNWTEKALKELA